MAQIDDAQLRILIKYAQQAQVATWADSTERFIAVSCANMALKGDSQALGASHPATKAVRHLEKHRDECHIGAADWAELKVLIAILKGEKPNA